MFSIVLLAVIMLLPGCSTLETTMNDTLKDYRQVTEDPFERNRTDADEGQNYTEKKENLRIGTYNTHIFNEVKTRNSPVTAGMARMMDDYDLIALQEIRDEEYPVVREFVNDRLPFMEYVTSEYVGTYQEEEQYAFFYGSRVDLIGTATYDGDFERPPYMIHFSYKNSTYTVIQVHVYPLQATKEIGRFEELFEYEEEEFGAEYVFIVGTFYNDCGYVDSDVLDDYKTLIEEDTTTTRDDCIYDNIILKRRYSEVSEYGVDYMDNDNNPDGLIRAMSDHYPLYVEIEG